MDRSASDIVVRVNDTRSGFEPGMRVELFQETDEPVGRTLQKAPFGPYRIIQCRPVTVYGAPKLDLTLRKLRRS